MREGVPHRRPAAVRGRRSLDLVRRRRRSPRESGRERQLTVAAAILQVAPVAVVLRYATALQGFRFDLLPVDVLTVRYRLRCCHQTPPWHSPFSIAAELGDLDATCTAI